MSRRWKRSGERMYCTQKSTEKRKNTQVLGCPVHSSESKVHGRPTRNSQSARSSPLLVQFAFPKRNANKKRSKALRDKQKQMKDITAKNTDLKKRVKRLQKRLQRLAKNSKGSSSTHLPAAMTPRTKTRSELRDAGSWPACFATHINFFVKLRLSRRLESLVPRAIALKTL